MVLWKDQAGKGGYGKLITDFQLCGALEGGVRGGQGTLLETSNLYYSEQRLIVCFNVIFKLNGYKHIPIIQNVK